MTAQTVFILGGSADIGRGLIARYLKAGSSVIATYRRPGALAEFDGEPQFRSCQLDLDQPATINSALELLKRAGWRWDLFVAASGDLAPIGPFLDLDGAEWQRGITNNAFMPCRVLQQLFPLRQTGGVVSAAFFAGGGTNNPFRNYSAYAVSKLALIKMCELLDDEIPDLKCFILGPGYTATKLHQATYEAGAQAGENLAKTKNFSNNPGTSIDEIFACLEWCRAQDREVIGGRNISVVHDKWREGGQALAASLRANSELFKLRRKA